MTAWSSGSTRAWRNVRALVLLRDQGRCLLRLDELPCPRHGRLCAVPCTRNATHAHHTRGRAVTGDDPRYIVAACRTCNLHVGEPKSDPPGRSVTQW